MSSTNKSAVSAKQLVGRPDVFGEDDDAPPQQLGRQQSGIGPTLTPKAEAGGGSSPTASTASRPAGASGLVGVGITFGQFHKDHVHAGALYVKQLQEHGPALESAMVLRGDILYEVDGVNSYRRSIERIQGKILGSPGSWVSLVFKRPAPGSDSAARAGVADPIESLQGIAITLQRRAPPPGHQVRPVPRGLMLLRVQLHLPPSAYLSAPVRALLFPSELA